MVVYVLFIIISSSIATSIDNIQKYSDCVSFFLIISRSPVYLLRWILPCGFPIMYAVLCCNSFSTQMNHLYPFLFKKIALSCCCWFLFENKIELKLAFENWFTWVPHYKAISTALVLKSNTTGQFCTAVPEGLVAFRISQSKMLYYHALSFLHLFLLNYEYVHSTYLLKRLVMFLYYLSKFYSGVHPVNSKPKTFPHTKGNTLHWEPDAVTLNIPNDIEKKPVHFTQVGLTKLSPLHLAAHLFLNK